MEFTKLQGKFLLLQINDALFRLVATPILWIGNVYSEKYRIRYKNCIGLY